MSGSLQQGDEATSDIYHLITIAVDRFSPQEDGLSLRLVRGYAVNSLD